MRIRRSVVEEAEQAEYNIEWVMAAFGLSREEVPKSVPFAESRTLHLPDRLTAKQIRRIGAASRIWAPGSFYVGDLLIWLESHPDAPVPYETVWKMFVKSGLRYQSLHNYKSVSRGFPVGERYENGGRHPSLSRQHHDAVRVLPNKDRKELLDDAARFGWSDTVLRGHANIRKLALGISTSRRPTNRNGHGLLVNRSDLLRTVERMRRRLRHLQGLVRKKDIGAIDSATDGFLKEIDGLKDAVEREIFLRHPEK